MVVTEKDAVANGIHVNASKGTKVMIVQERVARLVHLSLILRTTQMLHTIQFNVATKAHVTIKRATVFAMPDTLVEAVNLRAAITIAMVGESVLA